MLLDRPQEIARLNTLRGTKTEFLTPDRCDEHPRPFYAGFSPPASPPTAPDTALQCSVERPRKFSLFKARATSGLGSRSPLIPLVARSLFRSSSPTVSLEQASASYTHLLQRRIGSAQLFIHFYSRSLTLRPQMSSAYVSNHTFCLTATLRYRVA